MIFILLAFIGLLLIWALLGAILNPTAYMAYAAAAGTLIVFIQVKITQLQEVFSMGIE